MFRQQGNLKHFQDIFHNLCFIFHKTMFIFIILYICLFPIIFAEVFFSFANHAPKFKLMGYLKFLNPLNSELNPICYLLALLAHHFLHVSRIRVKSLTLRLLMSYIYGAPILDVSRLHTTTQHSR